MREVKPFRDAYLAKHLLCEVCQKRTPIEVHEICRGSHREKALDKEFAVLAVCRKCHDDLGDYSIWPLDRQICLKFLRSPELFGVSFTKFSKLRGHADSEFEPADVLRHAEISQ